MLKQLKKQKAEHGARAGKLCHAGFTLVETMVSVMLLMLMMAMVAGIVSPAFKMFIRMQKLQFAQMILDNVVEDVQDTVREATEYVKIYETDPNVATKDTANDADNPNGIANETKGLTLEYVNTDGYVVLISTGGCNETKTYRGIYLDTTAFSAVAKGQLLYRYYTRGLSGSDTSDESKYYYYNDTAGNVPIARAATTAFGSGYYMGNYLKIEFWFPKNSAKATIADNEAVTCLNATASLYSSSDMTKENLVATDDFVIDLRYQVVRENDITAVYGEGYYTTKKATKKADGTGD